MPTVEVPVPHGYREGAVRRTSYANSPMKQTPVKSSSKRKHTRQVSEVDDQRSNTQVEEKMQKSVQVENQQPNKPQTDSQQQ